jgi:predicted metal-binding membrane protein
LFSTLSRAVSLRRLLAPGFPLLALSLAVLAWTMLLVLDASPYARYLQHGDWAALGLATARLCAVVPGAAWFLPLFFYSLGWVLMTSAMMLPTTFPLVRVFDRMTATRQDATLLRGLLIAGYLLAWSAFGLLAYLLDWALHEGLGGSTWLAQRPWLPSAVVLALAGAFQFSKLKYHCLDKCRSPIGFVASHWHGPRPRREAFALGLAHGSYCVGCCWALMLLMFLVGMGNVAWMLILGLAMAIEKSHRWGRHVTTPIGGALIAAAGLLLLQPML